MNKKILKIAQRTGARVVGKLSDRGDGVFGALLLPKLVEELKAELTPSHGRRPGRPTNPKWARHPKVPMSDETFARLKRLADRASNEQRKVSPMQLAGRLLETAVEKYPAA
jgi:hypothetical protein